MTRRSAGPGRRERGRESSAVPQVNVLSLSPSFLLYLLLAFSLSLSLSPSFLHSGTGVLYRITLANNRQDNKVPRFEWTWCIDAAGGVGLG